MKKNIPISAICLWAVLSTAACTAGDDAAWPAGGVPLELYAAVEGYAGNDARTRAVTTQNKWEGGEEVYLHSDHYGYPYGSNIPVDSNGKLIATNDYFNWVSADDPREVYAFYPAHLKQDSDSPPVQADQTGEGYQQSDYLCAPCTYFYFTDPDQTLIFRHLTAKVVVHLKAGNGVTDGELQSAAILFDNLNRAGGLINIEDGITEQVTPAADQIIPNEVTPAADGYVRTVRALLTAQNLSGRKFVKITTPGGRNFYYTPGKDEANFLSGKQYEYHLTVTSEGIKTTDIEGGLWQPV